MNNHAQELLAQESAFQHAITEKDERGYHFLLKTKNLQSAVRKFHNLGPAFRHTGILACVDEGINRGLHCLGGGIIFDEEELQNFIEKSRAVGISSHTQCGAAQLAYFKKHPQDVGKQISWETIDDFAIAWAKKTAKKFGLAYQHYDEDQLFRPLGHHPARVIYFSTADAGFNPHQIPELPNGFVVLRYFHSTTAAAFEELKICWQIASGNHGMGHAFSKEEPLLIVVVGHHLYPWQNAESKVQRIKKDFVAKLPKEDQERIKVIGFTAPAQFLP